MSAKENCEPDKSAGDTAVPVITSSRKITQVSRKRKSESAAKAAITVVTHSDKERRMITEIAKRAVQLIYEIRNRLWATERNLFSGSHKECNFFSTSKFAAGKPPINWNRCLYEGDHRGKLHKKHWACGVARKWLGTMSRMCQKAPNLADSHVENIWKRVRKACLAQFELVIAMRRSECAAKNLLELQNSGRGLERKKNMQISQAGPAAPKKKPRVAQWKCEKCGAKNRFADSKCGTCGYVWDRRLDAVELIMPQKKKSKRIPVPRRNKDPRKKGKSSAATR